MLARTFKTAAELGLEDIVYEALHKVLNLLETNKPIQIGVDKVTFSMADWNEWDVDNKCGTAACIGGMTEMLICQPARKSWDSYQLVESDSMTEALEELCFVNSIVGRDLNKITRAQAVRALSNYLTTGDACWKEVLGV